MASNQNRDPNCQERQMSKAERKAEKAARKAAKEAHRAKRKNNSDMNEIDQVRAELNEARLALDTLRKERALLEANANKPATLIPRPLNSQFKTCEAMQLNDTNNKRLYNAIRRRVRRAVRSAGLDCQVVWKNQDCSKLARVKAVVVAGEPWLKKYQDAWPVEVLMREILKNERNVEKRRQKEDAEANKENNDIGGDSNSSEENGGNVVDDI